MTSRRVHALGLVAWFAVFAASSQAALPPDDDFETVVSETSNGYKRVLRPDGSPEPETYTFLRGGQLASDIADPTLDRMRFEDIAESLAHSLAARGYVPSKDRAKLKLLVVVYWGATIAPIRATPFVEVAPVSPQSSSRGGNPVSDAQPDFAQSLAEFMPYTEFPGRASGGASLAQPTPSFTPGMAGTNSAGLRADAARLLGYASSNDPDLLGSRYFVVLLAYDFQEKLRTGKNRLLWQTRFSIATRHHDFSQQLQAMVASASGLFGRDSGGLVRQTVPEGRVDIGETRVIGDAEIETPSNRGDAALAPDGMHVVWWRRGRHGFDLVVTALDGKHAPVVAEIPTRRIPTRLAWEDAQRVVIAGADGAAPLTVGATGRWLYSDNGAPAVLATNTPLGSSTTPLDSLRGRIEAKLPGRTITLLGTDDAKRRVLLCATGAPGPTEAGRYFVFDAADDLLIEVGRRQP